MYIDTPGINVSHHTLSNFVCNITCLSELRIRTYTTMYDNAIIYLYKNNLAIQNYVPD